MRIAELSRRSGVPVPTIKYYLREGLLPPGEATGPNQARYGEPHLDRLLLVRALREVGGVSVAAAGDVMRSLDEATADAHQLMGRAHRAVTPPSTHDVDNPEWSRARSWVWSWVRDMGWSVDPDAPALDRLADVVLTARRLDYPDLPRSLPRYAEAALVVAGPEVEAAAAQPDPAAVMKAVVTGTVLGEAALSAVRLLAHEHVSATRSPHPVDQGEDQPASPGSSGPLS
jgi:DNA-binding transcriptional MerR regulator